MPRQFEYEFYVTFKYDFMEQISVTPMISIRPNRVSLTHFVRRVNLGQFIPKPENRKCTDFLTTSRQSEVVPAKVKLQKKFHNFEISENSQRNLRDKIAYLYQFARSRKIRTYTGKFIPNFKVCFLTLTLPSSQIHPTHQITSECLDPLLQVLRQRLFMKNYVWRMEFQANGNVHYHIATDTYVDYFFIQKQWNAILEKLGYVSRYAQKMSKISLTEYQNRFSQNGKISPDVLYKRWVKGKAVKWSNPNTVDVKNATSDKSISLYISKYFSKKEKGSKCNDLDNESNSFGLRLCFWSRSLSKCKSETMPFDYYASDIIKILSKCENVLRCVFDYATVFYFSFNELSQTAKLVIGSYFNDMRREIHYEPA